MSKRAGTGGCRTGLAGQPCAEASGMTLKGGMMMDQRQHQHRLVTIGVTFNGATQKCVGRSKILGRESSTLIVHTFINGAQCFGIEKRRNRSARPDIHDRLRKHRRGRNDTDILGILDGGGRFD
jgi:hypothetical protein